VSLSDWARSGWLVEHRTSQQEIADLLGVADRDLRDCMAATLSEDWQLAIAYNAALQCAAAALAACGYRASREAHHYRVIQSLVHTLGAEAAMVAQLDAFRKKRNVADYDRAGTVSKTEAREMMTLAQNLRESVEEWLRRDHPGLLPK
jgi:exopolyphosphatase/pppGpp-phosphohydrolase